VQSPLASRHSPRGWCTARYHDQSRQEVSREGYYKGTRLDTTTVFRIVREAAKNAGVPNWLEVSPH
jgi:hypothetical protein